MNVHENGKPGSPYFVALCRQQKIFGQWEPCLVFQEREAAEKFVGLLRRTCIHRFLEFKIEERFE